MTTCVVWFRRDARLRDNPAWAAGARADAVVALFVIDPTLFDRATPMRKALLIAGLTDLDRSLRDLGGRLRVERGSPVEVVPRVTREVGADEVHINREVTPYGRRRDEAVSKVVPLVLHDGHYVYPPGSILTQKGRPYRVFAPFFRQWSERVPDVVGDPPPVVVPDRAGLGIPSSPISSIEGGETWALGRLDGFAMDEANHYAIGRERPDLDATSRLSVALKYGWLSPVRALRAVGEATPGRAAWVRQMAWRDFWGQLMGAHRESPRQAMRPEFRSVEWRDDPEGLSAWRSGMTGYPFVDAGMRQLLTEGWINNRVRLVVASFLVKDLLVDWRLGERHFRHLLIDADVAQNVGNWQWVAGVGADAAPYFRVFNPVTQGERFDPHGDYTRRWVPELSNLPNDLIHAPFRSADQVAEHGVVLGEDYPFPIVDHDMARERTLDLFRQAKSRYASS
jgi:deoxyribodipyrimidine photo-lyase